MDVSPPPSDAKIKNPSSRGTPATPGGTGTGTAVEVKEGPPWQHGFRPARGGEATPYIFVANSARAKEPVNPVRLREVFEKFGPVKAVVPVRNRGIANVVMETKEAAQAAVATLSGEKGKEHHGFGRVLYLRYSHLRKPPRPPLVVPDSVTDSAHLPLPEGLVLIENYVSKEEEQELVRMIDNESWHDDFSRRVQHYGYVFNYGTRNVDVNKPTPGGLPTFVRAILPSHPENLRGLSKEDAVSIAKSDQCTVNEYKAGQGIRPHVDTPEAFGTHIVSLSLLSPIVMDFRYPGSVEKKSIVLPPRSLLVLKGPSRDTWSHGIAHRSFDIISKAVTRRTRRVSLTFRVVTSKKTLNPLIPPAVERDYVHSFYERAARHFSHTRWNPWPHVSEFLRDSTSAGGSPVVVDVGCGNGKYLACLEGLGACGVGIDRSEGLTQVCRERNLPAAVGDALSVPVRSHVADVVISIAVVHHLSTKERRKKALSELLRVLKPVGGVGLVTAWAQAQPDGGRREFKGSDVLVGWQMPKRFLSEPKRRKLSNDATEETTTDGEKLVLQRYCHVFKQGELTSLLAEVAGEEKVHVRVRREYMNAGNCCLEFETTSATGRAAAAVTATGTSSQSTSSSSAMPAAVATDEEGG